MGNNSEDEVDDDYFLSPSLPVSTSIGYDFSRLPANGADYLRRVQLEAKQYPDVVTAEIDISQLPITTSIKLRLEDSFIKADDEIVPSEEWQQEITKNFTQTCVKVLQARSLLERGSQPVSNKPLPHFNNVTLWKKIIIGTIDKKETKNQSDDDCDNQDRTKLVCLTSGGQQPQLSFILKIPQVNIVDLLEWVTKWIEEDGFSHQSAVWIYSLLACLEKPLHCESIDILRKLSRTCSFIRSKHHLIDDKTLVTSLNLIICIIGSYFNQYDLTDNFYKAMETSKSFPEQPVAK